MTTQAAPEKKPTVAMTVGKGIQISTIDECFRFASAVVRSGIAPKGDTPEAVVVKLQAGAELGFSPMQALANITAVNGRVGIMGVGAIALIRRHPDCLQFVTGNDGEGEDRRGFALTQRKGEPAFRIEFTVKDAKRAGLWGKAGPWVQYSDDMLIWRAVARAAKRYWADALLGMPVAEELRDYPSRDVAYDVVRPTLEPPKADPLLAEEVEAVADEVFAPAALCEVGTKDEEQEKPTRCADCGFPYATPEDEKCGNCGSDMPF